jgi:hypothetical protein
MHIQVPQFLVELWECKYNKKKKGAGGKGAYLHLPNDKTHRNSVAIFHSCVVFAEVSIVVSKAFLRGVVNGHQD